MDGGFRPSWYTVFWLTLGVIALAVELWAIFNPAPHDTLSEHVWALMSRKPFWIWVVVGFCLWLLVHFASRGRLA